MSVTVNSRDYPNLRLVLFEEDTPVGVPAVQATLSALWRMASEGEQDEGSTGLARACLWNLVAFHSNPQRPRGDSGGESRRITTLLEQVTVTVPARVIHLEEWRDEEAPAPGKEVEAWVGTHCLGTGSGGRMVCCEQINLAGYGERGHSHFPALVRALLVPDLPVALLWLDDVPRRGRVLGQLLALSNRVVVDTQHTEDSDTLLAVNDLVRRSPGRLADLSWLRLTALRHLVADFFDPPGRAEQLQHLDQVRIEVSPRGRNSGLLLLGWLLSRCGYTNARAVDLGAVADLQQWQVQRPNGHPASVQFRTREEDGGLDGVICIEIEAGGDTFGLYDVDADHMSVKGPDRSLDRVPLRETDEPGFVVNALSANLRDPVFAQALAMAATLAETEQWNQ